MDPRWYHRARTATGSRRRSRWPPTSISPASATFRRSSRRSSPAPPRSRTRCLTLTRPGRVKLTRSKPRPPAPRRPNQARILKNGAEIDGLPGYLGPTDSSSRARIALTSAPIAVADGDYFECLVWQNASGSLDVETDPQTWFAIVALEYAAFRGAPVKLTADEPITDTTDTVVPWDATEFDTDGFWDGGNPTHLTVPSGVSRVRLLGNVRWQSSATGERQILITKNGAAFRGQPMARHGAAGLAGQNLVSPALAVSAGDVFELSVWHSASASLNVEAHSQTWLAIEAVE
jgi:hypothetical protein